jgi:hypothetical protein
MLKSEVFLESFRPVDQVGGTPFFLRDFRLCTPGYNDDGPGNRVLYIGPEPRIAETTETIDQFLDVMPWHSNADRTNAVAAAITRILHDHWPGEKPLILVTANKSHAGKTTVSDFIRGLASKADILYESLDWPMLSQLQRQLREDPQIGMIALDNVRMDSAGGRARCIRSAFIERLVTDPEVNLASPDVGDPVRQDNRYVVVINTNEGCLSHDLLNRALPIHLFFLGDTKDRKSAIGNPKLEFLPNNLEQIQAELLGMICR